MRERDFRRLGLIEPESRELLVKAWQQAGLNRSQWETMLRALSRSPRDFLTDLALGPVARHLSARMGFVPMEERPELAVWPNLSDCSEAGIGMKEARKLPFVVHGAILPGFQTGEGLPVGAVLATRGVVVPRAIGRDIGCRMRLTVLDLPDARARRKDFAPILRDHTRFGLDGVFSRPAQHPVLELPDWGLSHTTARLKDVAAAQLGSSGNGNHFVDLGRFEALEPGLPTNRLAILSHSGGRRPGGEVAYEYLRLARQRSKDLSRAYRPWAWLEFDSDLGEQFWRAMNLVERYASACHDVIHASLSSALGGSTLLTVDCCHNLATLEDGLVIHRKGTHRLAEGELAVLAGTMCSPTYLLRSGKR
ncbi:MAG: hypothetical protein AMXMBFR33_52460 [Candidatus Xenobia bacterium]